jgi:hypothetical protein
MNRSRRRKPADNSGTALRVRVCIEVVRHGDISMQVWQAHVQLRRLKSDFKDMEE